MVSIFGWYIGHDAIIINFITRLTLLLHNWDVVFDTMTKVDTFLLDYLAITVCRRFRVAVHFFFLRISLLFTTMLNFWFVRLLACWQWILVTRPAISWASASLIRSLSISRVGFILNCNLVSVFQKTLLLRSHNCAIFLRVPAVDNHICKLLL